MAGEVRVTTAVARVLRAFLEDPSAPRYGFDLMQQTRLPSGTLYPILARLEGAGWVRGRSEAIDPAAAGRPARRFYELTEHGQRAATRELHALVEELRPPARAGLHTEGGPAWT